MLLLFHSCKRRGFVPRNQSILKRVIKAAAPFVLFFLVVTASAQERRLTVGTSLDLVGGRTNSYGLAGSSSLLQSSKPYFFFYGGYPSINFVSPSQHTVLNGSYTFGWTRTATQNSLDSQSHAANLSFSAAQSQHLKITFVDGFEMTDDAVSFNGFRGVSPSGEVFRFVFSPVSARIKSRTNSASLAIDNTISDKSSLTYSVSHSLLDYLTDSPTTTTGLSNQQRINGGLTYSRRTTQKDTWSVGYSASYFDFSNFHDSVSQKGHVGYNTKVGRDVTLDLTSGLAQVHDLTSGQSYLGYNASARLQKTIESKADQTRQERTPSQKTFSLYYVQDSGDAGGLGSTVDTRSAGFILGWNRPNVTLFADIAAFDMRGRLDNPYKARGIRGSAMIGVPLNREFSIQGGAQYQEYDHTSPYAFSQKRVYLTLRYNRPNLIRK
jgi:hypothetical protein